MRGDVQRTGTVAPGHDRYGSGPQGPPPSASGGWSAVMTIRPRVGWHRAALCRARPPLTPMKGQGWPGGQPGGALAGRRRRSAAVSGVRTAEAMGLRNLQDLAGQRRLGPGREHRRRPHGMDPPPGPARRRTPRRGPGHPPLPDLAPARQAGPPRPPANPRHQRRLALEGCLPRLLAAAPRPASTRLTRTNSPTGRKEAPRRGRSRCAPGHTGCSTHHPPRGQTDMKSKNRLQHAQ